MLKGLKCKSVYASLGNHDVVAGAAEVTSALGSNGIQVIRNSYLPIERGKGRMWLAGLDDAVEGSPDLDAAVPEKIRGLQNEPVVLMCHAPDYAMEVLAHPAGQPLT